VFSQPARRYRHTVTAERPLWSINLSKASGGSESVEGMLAWLFMPLLGVSTVPGVETWDRLAKALPADLINPRASAPHDTTTSRFCWTGARSRESACGADAAVFVTSRRVVAPHRTEANGESGASLTSLLRRLSLRQLRAGRATPVTRTSTCFFHSPLRAASKSLNKCLISVEFHGFGRTARGL